MCGERGGVRDKEERKRYGTDHMDEPREKKKSEGREWMKPRKQAHVES